MEKKIPIISYSLLAVILFVSSAIAFLLYLHTSNLLQDRLKERLVAIASTAAISFDPNDIERIQSMDDVDTDAYRKTTFELQKIRNTNSDVYYAYILRPTSNPDVFAFVADADSIDPNAKVDLDENGVIDEADQLNFPGQEYDVSELPSLKVDALKFPTTDPEPVLADEWGTFLSGYAPIFHKGKTIAVLAIDVEVTDFTRLVTATFLPFAAFVFALFVLLTILTTSLVRIWGARVDDLKDLDRQKDELLGMVSHQLATPISGLRWNLEMIAEGDLGSLNEKQKDEIKTMQGVVGNLADLVSMILDVSRIQLGKMKVDKTEIDLKQFFKEITDVLIPRSHEKKQTFTFNIHDHLEKGIIDKRLTHMAIENLISNAVKYTPEGGSVKVDVDLHNGFMRCVVADTGMGIPKKDQEKIFGKLYRASNVAAVDGNGFGLYVAKGAIESQGGRIWFESQEGKGTRFTVELPITKA